MEAELLLISQLEDRNPTPHHFHAGSHRYMNPSSMPSSFVQARFLGDGRLVSTKKNVCDDFTSPSSATPTLTKLKERIAQIIEDKSRRSLHMLARPE